MLYRRLIQFTLFLILIGVGAWIRISTSVHDYPPLQEAPSALVIAAHAEPIRTLKWPIEGLRSPSIQHQLLATSLKGFEQGTLNFRDYCFLPLFLSVLLLLLFPCLGWRKHGGVFLTIDGPLWGLAFAVFSPIGFMGATSLTPFTFQCVVFLAMLLAARSYAQWPGYWSVVCMGILIAGAIVISPESLWTLLLLTVAIVFGVGWTRLTLYWRTAHVCVTLLIAGGLLAFAALCGWVNWPILPMMQENGAAVVETCYRIAMLPCTYGIGLIAWLGIVILPFIKKDARWERVFAILFFMSLLFSILFKSEVSFVFVVPLVVLTPIMVAMIITSCPKATVRWWLGNVILVGLLLGLVTTMKVSSKALRYEEHLLPAIAQLEKESFANAKYDLRLDETDASIVAQVLWIFRHYASGKSVAIGPGETLDAAVYIVRVASPLAKQLALDTSFRTAFHFEIGLNEKRQYIVFVKE